MQRAVAVPEPGPELKWSQNEKERTRDHVAERQERMSRKPRVKAAKLRRAIRDQPIRAIEGAQEPFANRFRARGRVGDECSAVDPGRYSDEREDKHDRPEQAA